MLVHNVEGAQYYCLRTAPGGLYVTLAAEADSGLHPETIQTWQPSLHVLHSGWMNDWRLQGNFEGHA